MSDDFFAFGTTLAAMDNWETYYGDRLSQPPHLLPSDLVPLVGDVSNRALSGQLSRDGYSTARLVVPLIHADDLNALLVGLFGNYTTASIQCYFTSVDETNHYSPFYAWIDRPVIRDYQVVLGGLYRQQVAFPLTNCIIQTIAASSTHSQTSSERLIYADTTGGDFTVTLPSAAGVTANTIYSIMKTAAAHTLTIARAGSDTINGSASSLTLTALYGRYDYYSDGASAWRTV
jgi:hypothetical protein